MSPYEYQTKFGNKVSTSAIKRSKRRNANATRRNVLASRDWNKRYTGRVSGPRHNERTMPVGSPDGTDPAIRAAKGAERMR